MFILKDIMRSRGFSVYVKTERHKTFPSIREVFFKENKKSNFMVSVTVDERELEGISDINKIITIYESFIKNTLSYIMLD